MFEVTIFAIAGIMFVYYLISEKKKSFGSSNKAGKKDKALGDKEAPMSGLIDYEEIEDSGLIKLPAHRYRLVLGIIPVNFELASAKEQASIWYGFRQAINMLNLPTKAKITIQSKELDIKDYIKDLEQKAEAFENYPLIRKYGKNLAKSLQQAIEEHRVSDDRRYIVLKYDALEAEGAVSNVTTDSKFAQVLSDIQKNILKKTQSTSKANLKKIAKQELENTAISILDQLESTGVRGKILNKIETEDYIYTSFNKDLAPHARLSDIYESGSIDEYVPRSASPFMYQDAFEGTQAASQHEHEPELEERSHAVDYTKTR